jgi:hypothetical protein
MHPGVVLANNGLVFLYPHVNPSFTGSDAAIERLDGALRRRHPRLRAGRGPGAHGPHTNAQGVRPEAGHGGKRRDRREKKHGVLRERREADGA